MVNGSGGGGRGGSGAENEFDIAGVGAGVEVHGGESDAHGLGVVEGVDLEGVEDGEVGFEVAEAVPLVEGGGEGEGAAAAAEVHPHEAVFVLRRGVGGGFQAVGAEEVDEFGADLCGEGQDSFRDDHVGGFFLGRGGELGAVLGPPLFVTGAVHVEELRDLDDQ